MSKETEIRCCVSGSFSKFKSEIDLVIDELRDLGVTVLAPEKGWVILPEHEILALRKLDFRPLKSEIGMSPGKVEDDFLANISVSDFLYVVNPGGYIGQMVAFEIGFTMGCNILIFSMEPINTSLILDPVWKREIAEKVQVLPIEKAVEEINKLKELA